jgi:hypothetical protein
MFNFFKFRTMGAEFHMDGRGQYSLFAILRTRLKQAGSGQIPSGREEDCIVSQGP